MGAHDPERNASLIRFAIVVKFMALAFLLGYWVFHRHLPMVLASGLVDGAMGVVLLIAYRRWRRD
jgi:hypothetical protein